jgi:peroxiredoxin
MPRRLGLLSASALSLTMILAIATPAQAAGGGATNFTVRDLNGKHVRLSDFHKNVLLMSFWATWCKPCIVELRHLEKLYQKYKAKGFVVLAVSMDGPETQAGVKPVVQTNRLTFPVVVDHETRIVKLYNPKHAAPFSLLFKKGKLIKTREGFQVSDLPAIDKEIQDQLR